MPSGKRKPDVKKQPSEKEQQLRDDRKRKEWNVKNEKTDTYSELPGPDRRGGAVAAESEPETLQREEPPPAAPEEAREPEGQEWLEQLEMQQFRQ